MLDEPSSSISTRDWVRSPGDWANEQAQIINNKKVRNPFNLMEHTWITIRANYSAAAYKRLKLLTINEKVPISLWV
jgi:hypothetical protein